MRITMSMITRQYSKNLNNSLSQLNNAYNKGTTFRRFDKTSDDPFNASKAYRLRREADQNDTYQSLLSDASDQLDTAQSAMLSINKILSEVNSGDCLQGITGTTNEDGRKVIAQKLRQYQNALISPLNTQFGGKYIFGGSEMANPPFTIDNSKLYYRGVDVDTGALLNGSTTTMNGALIQFGKAAGTTLDGYTIQIADGAEGVSVSGTTITVSMDLASAQTNQNVYSVLKSHASDIQTATGADISGITFSGDLNRPVEASTTSAAAYSSLTSDQMKSLAQETSLIDLGMGLQFNAGGEINEQSAFDAAIPGISFLGYGTTTAGGATVSQNLYSLLGQIADQLESPSFSIDSVQPYLDQLSGRLKDSGGSTVNAGIPKLLAEITKSGTKSTFLSTTKTNLESMGDAILKKDQDVEFLDPELAFENFYMQQFNYNAALQMGTKIMSKTFLDFMA